MLALHYRDLLAHDPGTRVGSDPEELHKLRVAVRRLRSTLRTARPLLEADWVGELRAELKWLGTTLGAARDLDVQAARLREDIQRLPAEERSAGEELLAAVESDREAAHASVLEALGSGRYLTLLVALEQAVEAPRVRAKKPTVDRLARREFKKLRAVADDLGDEPSDDALHQMRIRVKRARYAAELAAPAVGKPARRFARQAARLQALLGAHQDARVQEQLVVASSRRRRAPRVALAAGRIAELQRLRRAQTRRSLPRAWRRVERSGSKAWK
jgi:CHAD domain-containing protein